MQLVSQLLSVFGIFTVHPRKTGEEESSLRSRFYQHRAIIGRMRFSSFSSNQQLFKPLYFIIQLEHFCWSKQTCNKSSSGHATDYWLCPEFLVILFVFFQHLLINQFLATLSLRCHMWAFSSCGEWRPLFVAMRSSHCGGFSCGVQASVVAAQRLSVCGTWTQFLCSMWHPPRPGTEPMSPALAGGFLTTGSPGMSLCHSFKVWVIEITALLSLTNGTF